jgi:Gas vesicle protein G
MLLVDDVLASPFRGLFWIFRELHNAVQEEAVNEAEDITQQLSELYMMLETGKISEAEFDESEAILLDRLDALEEDKMEQEADDRDDQ